MDKKNNPNKFSQSQDNYKIEVTENDAILTWKLNPERSLKQNQSKSTRLIDWLTLFAFINFHFPAVALPSISPLLSYKCWQLMTLGLRYSNLVILINVQMPVDDLCHLISLLIPDWETETMECPWLPPELEKPNIALGSNYCSFSAFDNVSVLLLPDDEGKHSVPFYFLKGFPRKQRLCLSNE